jgi:hypothetical protein
MMNDAIPIFICASIGAGIGLGFAVLFVRKYFPWLK